MTSDILLDSCILAKTVLDEPDSNLAVALIESANEDAKQILFLDIAVVEVTNVIWKNCYRKLIDGRKANQVFVELMKFEGDSISTKPLLSRGLQLAIHYRIAVYDAVFVAAVEDAGCRGVTTDAALVRKIHDDFPQIELLCPTN